MNWMWTPDTWDGTWASRCLDDLRVEAVIAEREDRADLFTLALDRMAMLLWVPNLHTGVWS